MRTTAALAIVLAACGQESEDKDRLLERRRTALGLESAPLPLKRAMGLLRKLDAEALLEREDDPERLRDHALRIENLLARATGELRPDLAKDAATALAIAPNRKNARMLLEACAACHVKHREER